MTEEKSSRNALLLLEDLIKPVKKEQVANLFQQSTNWFFTFSFLREL